MIFVNKTSVQWLSESNYEIIEANGWDKEHYDYSFYFDKISKEEFERRIKKSIVKLKSNETF
jgi:hypothetical protein